jgi:hypothetical protein
MSAARPLMNTEPPVSNRTVHELELQQRHRMHQQRLNDIQQGKRRRDLGNQWRKGPLQSRPQYRHLTYNGKKAQLQNERYDTIERENKLLLDKMSALMVARPVLDPTEGTWEFSPGVRLNKNQLPVIDHGISHQPPMPQRGAAKHGESLNVGTRRRELERITQENRGIVSRIQERRSHYPAAQWQRRSDEHDKLLMLMRRPATSHGATALPLPPPPKPLSRTTSPLSSSRGARQEPPRRHEGGRAHVSTLLGAAEAGDAHLLVGLAPGLVSGAALVLRPHEAQEESVVAHEAWLRKDGLIVLLKEPCRQSHPVGSHVYLAPQR